MEEDSLNMSLLRTLRYPARDAQHFPSALPPDTKRRRLRNMPKVKLVLSHPTPTRLSVLLRAHAVETPHAVVEVRTINIIKPHQAVEGGHSLGFQSAARGVANGFVEPGILRICFPTREPTERKHVPGTELRTDVPSVCTGVSL